MPSSFSTTADRLSLERALSFQPHTVPIHRGSWPQVNCYPFALDQRFTGPKLPGEYSMTKGAYVGGDLRTLGQHLTPEGLHIMLGLDGLPLLEEDFVPSGVYGWVVLAFLAPGRDFHFARYVGGGEILHKRGIKDVERLSLEERLFTGDEFGGQHEYHPIGAYWCEPSELGQPLPGALEAAEALLSRL